jgi:hypothetical protein
MCMHATTYESVLKSWLIKWKSMRCSVHVHACSVNANATCKVVIQAVSVNTCERN